MGCCTVDSSVVLNTKIKMYICFICKTRFSVKWGRRIFNRRTRWEKRSLTVNLRALNLRLMNLVNCSKTRRATSCLLSKTKPTELEGIAADQNTWWELCLKVTPVIGEPEDRNSPVTSNRIHVMCKNSWGFLIKLFSHQLAHTVSSKKRTSLNLMVKHEQVVLPVCNFVYLCRIRFST